MVVLISARDFVSAVSFLLQVNFGVILVHPDLTLVSNAVKSKTIAWNALMSRSEGITSKQLELPTPSKQFDPPGTSYASAAVSVPEPVVLAEQTDVSNSFPVTFTNERFLPLCICSG